MMKFRILSEISTQYNRCPLYWITGSGLLLGGVFSYGVPVIFTPLLLIPWLHYYLGSGARNQRLLHDIIASAVFFIPFMAVVLIWFLQADLPNTVGVSNNLATGAALFSWTVMAVVTGVCMLPIVFMLRWIKNGRHKPIITSSVIAAAWVCCEWIRSLGFSIFLYGEGASIGDFWNFGSLGLSLISTPLGYASRIIGMYGLSFLIVFISVLLYKSMEQKQYRHSILPLLTIVGVTFIGYSLASYSTQHTTTQPASVLQQSSVGSVDISIPIKNETKTLKKLIVLPEYSDLFDGGFSSLGEDYVSDRLAAGGISIDVTQKDSYGTMIFRDKNGNILDSHTKQLLIPTGEYLPAILTTFFNSTGQSEFVDSFDANRRLTKGAAPRTQQSSDVILGSVSCSGILSRQTYRDYARSGANVFTNSAALTTFNGSSAYLNQALQMARFHATANNRTYIQATKGAPAFVLDNNGRFVVAPEDTALSFIDFEFTPNTYKTTYTILGEWPLKIATLMVTVYAAQRLFKHMRHNRNEH